MKVGSQTIWPPLLLAPMAGLTHSALRTMLLHFGGVGLLSTEMLSAARLPAESVDHSPYLFRTTKESPLSHQLMLTDEKHIAPAFAALHRLGADVIDLNLGCPAPQIRRSGGGSRLMEDPARVRRLVASARQHTCLPLTAKIRLGETLDAAKLRDFCRMLEGEGVDMITVHARLRGESFARRPRWEWVANVKRWIDIPVVANGGIDSIASARTCLEQSGADGLMIGRAAARSPWIAPSRTSACHSCTKSLPRHWLSVSRRSDAWDDSRSSPIILPPTIFLVTSWPWGYSPVDHSPRRARGQARFLRRATRVPRTRGNGGSAMQGRIVIAKSQEGEFDFEPFEPGEDAERGGGCRMVNYPEIIFGVHVEVA